MSCFNFSRNTLLLWKVSCLKHQKFTSLLGLSVAKKRTNYISSLSFWCWQKHLRYLSNLNNLIFLIGTTFMTIFLKYLHFDSMIFEFQIVVRNSSAILAWAKEECLLNLSRSELITCIVCFGSRPTLVYLEGYTTSSPKSARTHVAL